MPSMKDVKEVTDDGKVKEKRKFSQSDWAYVAEFVLDEYESRKKARSDREKGWAEIDRQVRMEPKNLMKRLPNGKLDPGRRWMTDMELPLQAQCLEVSTADMRRFLFAENEVWFRAHAETPDDYLERVNLQSLIKGDELEVPSLVNQKNVNDMVQAFVMHTFKQYDFYTRWDRSLAEAFKYGMGVGRIRMHTKNLYVHESAGVRKDTTRLPVFCPVPLKNLYLDDTRPTMHSATEIGPAHIAYDNVKLENLHLAAARGSDDPDDEDGGWMPKNLKGVEAGEDGYVEILEYEGDLVVPRKTTRSIVIRGAIVTVVKGAAETVGEISKRVIRFRFRKKPYSSYLLMPYHYEGCDEIYPTSPLEKGRPVQMMASDALCRAMDSAALKLAPPVGWDRTDNVFAKEGGPRIAPYEQWATAEDVKVHADVGGDPNAMVSLMSNAVSMYAELTGVLPGRLGAQTKSHTTAFSKEQEIERGAIRTIDFARSVGHGALTRCLYMTYEMARDAIRSKIDYYIPTYDGFVELSKDQLPENCVFEWYGAGGPQDQARRKAEMAQALQLALQMEQVSMQMGGQKVINMEDAIKAVLREGGWSDVDSITAQTVPQGQGPQPGPPQEPNPGIQAVALQQMGAMSDE